jgi:hypothetical protein
VSDSTTPHSQTRKSHPAEFQAVWDGTKTFDYRRHPTNLAPGDWFTQEEYDPEGDFYTGRSITHQITYVLGGDRGRDRAKELGLPLFAEVLGLGRVVKRVERRRHVLVVPPDPGSPFQVEHYGCPSTVRIYRPGDHAIDGGYEGPAVHSVEDLRVEHPYATITGWAVTEHHCKIAEFLHENGWEWTFAHVDAEISELRAGEVVRVLAGRHDIVYRERFDPPCGEYEGDYEDWLEIVS